MGAKCQDNRHGDSAETQGHSEKRHSHFVCVCLCVALCVYVCLFDVNLSYFPDDIFFP